MCLPVEGTWQDRCGAGRWWCWWRMEGWIIEYNWDAGRARTHSSESSEASNWCWVQSEAAGGSGKPPGTAARPRRVPFNNGWFKGFMKWPPTSPAINGVLAVQSDQAQMIAGSAGFTASSSAELKMSRRDSWPVKTPELWPRSPACTRVHVFARKIKSSTYCVTLRAGLFSVILAVLPPPTPLIDSPNFLKINLNKHLSFCCVTQTELMWE